MAVRVGFEGAKAPSLSTPYILLILTTLILFVTVLLFFTLCHLWVLIPAIKTLPPTEFGTNVLAVGVGFEPTILLRV